MTVQRCVARVLRYTSRVRSYAVTFLLLLSSASPAIAEEPQDGLAQALDYTVLIQADGVYGSGLLLDPAAGLLVTNQHVVADMTSPPKVTFHDGSVATARIVELDAKLDLALLAVPPRRGSAPRWGDAGALRPGDEVYAIGAPRKLAFTVSRGIVSYVGRPVEGTRYLQTDLPINQGNSGGPVINRRGELVGIMTFVLKRAQGIAFALPASYVRERFAARLSRLSQTAQRR